MILMAGRRFFPPQNWGLQSVAEVKSAFLVKCEVIFHLDWAAAISSAQCIRFGSSGSEVAQATFRLARSVTGKRIILKFEGHYHGLFDNILWSTAPTQNAAGPEEAPVLVLGTLGQDPVDAAGLDVIGWNDLAALEVRLARGDIATVIMEPAKCNQGAIPPAPGHLEGALAACRKHGAILIFDEVITGFRLGREGVQKRFGVTPDLPIFTKAIANGFPAAALVGRADLLDMLVTKGVLHGGTFNAQPVTMAAMVATQQALRPDYTKPGRSAACACATVLPRS